MQTKHSNNYLYEEFVQRLNKKTLLCWQSYQYNQIKFERIHRYCRKHGFIFDSSTVNTIQKTLSTIINFAFNDQIKRNDDRKNIQLQLTHVHALPSRTEQGLFLIIELGNPLEDVRFSLVVLLGKNVPAYEIVHSRGYNLPEQIRHSHGLTLLEHLAFDLKEFLEQIHSFIHLPHSLLLGLLLHFPLHQNELNHVQILSWSDRFNCPDLLEHDFIVLLQQSLERHVVKHHIQILACIEGHVAALISVAFEYPNTFLSLTFKDQFQLAFVEDTEILRSKNRLRAHYRTILSLDFQYLHSNKSIQSHALFQTLLTSIDTSLMHQFKVNYFDIFTSDRCLLEIIRLLILQLCRDEELFHESQWSKSKFNQSGSFDVKFLSCLLQRKYSALKPYLNELGLQGMKKIDLIYMEYICHLILRRSTQILSCLIVCFAERYNQENVTIAIESDLYRRCPIYQVYLHREIEYLCKRWITMFHFVYPSNKSYVGLTKKERIRWIELLFFQLGLAAVMGLQKTQKSMMDDISRVYAQKSQRRRRRKERFLSNQMNT